MKSYRMMISQIAVLIATFATAALGEEFLQNRVRSKSTYSMKAPIHYKYSVILPNGGEHSRSETVDRALNRINGSYEIFEGDEGYFRVVSYTADEKGFRAVVHSNEPGTGRNDPAHVHMYSFPTERKADDIHSPISPRIPVSSPILSRIIPLIPSPPTRLQPARNLEPVNTRPRIPLPIQPVSLRVDTINDPSVHRGVVVN